MFALDSLVRSAVQQTLNLLSPDNGANLIESASDHLEFSFEEGKIVVEPESAVITPTPPQVQSLQKSLAVVQNFIKHLALELENGSSSQTR